MYFKKILKLTLLYIHTIKHLKVSQIYHRLRYKVNRQNLSLSEVNATYFPPCTPIGIPKAHSGIGLRGHISFLGGCVHQNQIIWDAVDRDKLWRYNLHYFDFLNGNNSKKTFDLEHSLISDWINANPPCRTIGWDPYPTSLRIINWIKWSHNVQRLPAGFAMNLVLQTRCLRRRLEYHLLANHLFVNAKALVFSGVSFFGKEADEWLVKGMTILRLEIDEQILPDGGHFERSPMYHSMILEDVLDLLSLLNRPSRELPPTVKKFTVYLESKALSMVSWLREMCHPDGQISFFNDAAFMIAPTLFELERYATSLDLNLRPISSEKKIGGKYFQESGFVSVCWGSDTRLLADIGSIKPDYQPGHSHAESLCFELSVKGERFFVNSGISTYENSPLRLFQRATKSHNTVEVDGKNSSEVWSSFRVAKRAVVSSVSFQSAHDRVKCYASHNGYSNSKSKVIHNREWIMRLGSVCISDNIVGSFKNAVFFLHIHPNIVAQKIDETSVCLTGRYGTQVFATFKGGFVRLKQGQWNEGFHKSVVNQHIQIEFLSDKLTSEINWIAR